MRVIYTFRKANNKKCL